MTHQHSNPSTVTLNLRIPLEIRDQLKDLADITGRTKSFLASQAIESYLTTQAWQIKAIEKAIKKANRKKAKFIDHQSIVDWLGAVYNSLG